MQEVREQLRAFHGEHRQPVRRNNGAPAGHARPIGRRGGSDNLGSTIPACGSVPRLSALCCS
jgi:hypothetical protein